MCPQSSVTAARTGPVLCAIASNSHLVFARVLARSFLEQHHDGRVAVLVVDRADPAISYDAEPFAVTFVEELGLPRFHNLVFRYNVVELANALKPSFMLHLHRALGCRSLCYLDTDILVTGDLGELYRRLETSNLILTPHITAPVEDDAHIPADRTFLLSGCYNLGFLGVAFTPATLQLLEWWQRRLSQECLHQVEQGLQHDQRWMDLAPSFLPELTVLRDPGYNMAYWNLTHRRLEQREGRWWVGDSALRFFHFSGLDLANPGTISRFQDRYRLNDRPDLEALFTHYLDLVQAEGIEQQPRISYSFGCFANGVRIPEVARRILRRTDPLGDRWPDPFQVEEGSFYRWLLEPVRPEHPVKLPRLALEAWHDRTDLQARFPDPTAGDLLELATWYAETAPEELGLPDELLGATRQSLASRHHATFDNGVAFPPVARRILDRVDPDSSRWPHPEQTGTQDSFFGWLLEPVVPPHHRIVLPRLALLIWEEREDLRQLWPEPRGRDSLLLASWFAHNSCELADELVRPTREMLAERRWDRFDNGEPFPTVVATALARLDPTGLCWPEPTVTTGPCTLYQWLHQSAVQDSPIPLPHLAMLVWEQREDLQQRFPAPLGRDLVSFARWLVERGAAEAGLHEDMLAPITTALQRLESSR